MPNRRRSTAAACEFADVERMVDAAERLLGPYRWGRYDILVLPPSFPFGGMENPCVTFATPTILAGDRSLVSLIAHELAHSWSGNLRDQRHVARLLAERRRHHLRRAAHHGSALRRRARRHARACSPVASCSRRSSGSAAPPHPIRSCTIDLDGRDPDDGATRIPYEKGAALMTLLEQTFGRPRFDEYLRGYFERYAFQSIETATFIDDLRTHLLRRRADGWHAAADRVDLTRRDCRRTPSNHIRPRSMPSSGTRDAFASGTPAAALPSAPGRRQEWLHFLDALPASLEDRHLQTWTRPGACRRAVTARCCSRGCAWPFVIAINRRWRRSSGF